MEDLLAVRVTGFMTSRDGFVDALGEGKSLLNDRDRYGGRVQILYMPTDDLSLRVILDYSEIDEICCAAATFRNNYFSFDGGPGSDALLASMGVPLLDEDRFTDYMVQANQLPVSRNEDSGVSAELNWDINDTNTLTSISAYRTFNTTDDADVDFNTADIASRFNLAESEMFSQELRITGSRGRVDYLAGAFYFNQNLDNWSTTEPGADFESFVVNGDSDLRTLVNSINALSALTGGAIPRTGPAALPGTRALNIMLQDHEAWALFGQVDIELLEQWRVSAGLRYTGELETMGGELEVAWSPLDSLALTEAYVYNEAKYDEFEQAACWVAAPFQTGMPDPGRRNPGDAFCDRSGDRLAGNPEHTILLSTTATRSFSDTLSGYVHTDYNYRTSIVTDANADPLKRQDGFGLLNVRAGLVLEPIDLEITLWARNLLDEDWRGATFDVPLQDGKLAAYLRETRTYGVSLRKRF